MGTEADRLARSLSSQFIQVDPAGAALELERQPAEETAALLRQITPAEAASLLARLSPASAGEAMRELGTGEQAARILAAMDFPAAARLVARLEAGPRQALMDALPPALAKELAQIVSYPPQTAGALMDPDVLALRPEMSAREALERLRALRHKRIHRLFVVSPEHMFLGSVRVRDLALADPAATLDSLALADPPPLPATATAEDVTEALEKTGAVILPVVDFEGRLLGALRQEALLEAAREDASMDIQSMVGAGKEERALSRASLAVRKRLPWLQINLGTAFLAAAVVGVFEDLIAANTALAVLLPVVAGQSGNTGAQALAVTMRGIALREIRSRQWLRICLKEMNVGLLNGVAVALTTSAAVFLWSRSPGLALVIGISMVLSMLIAGLAGAAIPLILSALGQDPAQSSSIILTTVTDVAGFFSFLGIATMLSELL